MTRELFFGKKDQRTTQGTTGGLGFGKRDRFTQNKNHSTQRKLPNKLPETSLNPPRFLWHDDIPYGWLYGDRSVQDKISDLLSWVAWGFVEVWLSQSVVSHFYGDCLQFDHEELQRRGNKVLKTFDPQSLRRDQDVIQLIGRYEAWGMSTAETIALAILKGMIIVTRYPEHFEGIEEIEVWSLDDFYAYYIDSLRQHLKRCYRNSNALWSLPPNDEPPSGPGGSPRFPGSLGGGGSLPPFPGSGPSNPPLNPDSNDNPGGSSSSNTSASSNSITADFETGWLPVIEAAETALSPEPSRTNRLQPLEQSLAADPLPGETNNSVTPVTAAEIVDPGLISETQPASKHHDLQPNQNQSIENQGSLETQNSLSQASVHASNNPRVEAGNDSSSTLIAAALVPGINQPNASSSDPGKDLGSDTNSTNGGADVNPIQPTPVQQVSGADGNQIIPIQAGDGITIVDSFGGVGRGVNPTPEIISAVDTLQFKGARFKAENMILTQKGNDLIITFEGDLVDQVVVRNFSLENLDNISQENGASITLVNILFDGDTSPQDSYDVVDANWVGNQVLKPNSVTFLNDQDNYVMGFDNANNVINGQGGNDTLITFSGNDILRGGAGNDTLDGGAGINQLWGGSGADTFVLSPYGLNYIHDFTIGGDRIGLANGLTMNQVKVEQGTGVNSGSTLIKLISNDTTLAVLIGVQANTLTTDIFLPNFSVPPLRSQSRRPGFPLWNSY